MKKPVLVITSGGIGYFTQELRGIQFSLVNIGQGDVCLYENQNGFTVRVRKPKRKVYGQNLKQSLKSCSQNAETSTDNGHTETKN